MAQTEIGLHPLFVGGEPIFIEPNKDTHLLVQPTGVRPVRATHNQEIVRPYGPGVLDAGGSANTAA